MTIMENHKLLITFPISNVDKIKQRFSPLESILFLYLGKDLLVKRDLEKKLGGQFTSIKIAKFLNEAANDIRKEHVKWIDQLNKLYGDNIFWWFGSISAKNMYNNNLFLFSCYLELLKILWNTEGLRFQLVFVESIGLLKAICQWASKQEIDVEVIYLPSENYNYVINIVTSLLKLGYFYVSLLNRCINAYFSKKKYGRKKVSAKKVAIVNTYVLNSSLGNDGSFQDPYLPFLHEYLTHSGYQILIHPVLYGFHLNYRSIYRRMCQSKAHFIIPDDFLKVSDYLSALSYFLYAFRLRIQAPKFRDLDLTVLLKEEQQKSLAEISSLLAGLIYRLFLRLGQANLNVELIISWYENQVNDKGLISGARQAFPTAKIIGAQIFFHCPNWINTLPSQSEVDYEMVPHVILETSDYQCKIVQSYANNISCQTAAALRYAHIFNEGSHTKKICLTKQSPAILVLLPHDVGECVDMLETIKGITNKLNEDVQMLIKCHQCVPSEQLMQEFGKRAWPPRYTIYAGSLPEALNIATMVIASNTSAMVEAAARGIPVICLGRQTVLNQNYLEGLVTNLITECFTENELEAAVNRYLKPSPAEREAYCQEGERIVKLFFTPVNEKTMQPFLGKN
jgi:hypothetical protein